jgi:hypothetical protein
LVQEALVVLDREAREQAAQMMVLMDRIRCFLQPHPQEAVVAGLVMLETG